MFEEISPCSSLSPAIAKILPSIYSWRGSDARSISRYSSSVKYILDRGGVIVSPPKINHEETKSAKNISSLSSYSSFLRG